MEPPIPFEYKLLEGNQGCERGRVLFSPLVAVTPLISAEKAIFRRDRQTDGWMGGLVLAPHTPGLGLFSSTKYQDEGWRNMLQCVPHASPWHDQLRIARHGASLPPTSYLTCFGQSWKVALWLICRSRQYPTVGMR